MSYEQAPMPALIIRHTGQSFPLTSTSITIGRQPDNTIVLADSQVSRHHATISLQAGTFVIQDLGSANGTYVNEQRIEAAQILHDGDVIRLGSIIFDVQMISAMDETMQMPLSGPPAAAYRRPATEPRRSILPVIIGLLAVGVVAVCAVIALMLLFSRLRGGEPIVLVQSPSQGAQIAAGNEIILQATASGASNITRLELKVNDFLVATATSPDAGGTSSLTVSQPWTFGQTGPHVISAVAYTSRSSVSAPASVSFTVVGSVSQATPTATQPGPSPTVPQPTATQPGPSPTAPPPTTPPPDTPLPDTPTPTHTPQPTHTPTPEPSATQPPPPQVEYFRASPNTIIVGGCTTLEWGAVHNATTASIDQGIGGVGTPGSRVVCPAETTTYVMTAIGQGGTATTSTTVTVQAALPDLTVESISFAPVPPVQGQDNEVHIILRNIGTGAAGPFHWEWQPGTAAPQGGHVPGGLNAGETTVVTTIWHPNNWYANLATVARVDVNNAVVESDETNNELQVNVQVIPPSEVITTLTSQASLDGYVIGGQGSYTNQEIRVGNYGTASGENVYRGFLSFDLTGIPASATIQSIELRFFQAEIIGDPYGKLSQFFLKHVDYGSSLEVGDFNATDYGSAWITSHTSPGDWYAITSDTLADWLEEALTDGRSRFQLRLQFSPETDDGSTADYIRIESGNNFMGTGNLPQLTITYIP